MWFGGSRETQIPFGNDKEEKLQDPFKSERKWFLKTIARCVLPGQGHNGQS
jgi:hypothetical protein